MKYVKVNVISSILSERGQKRIENHNKPYSETEKDTYGYTREQYEDINISIPEDSIHYGKEEETTLQLDDEDFDIIKRPSFFPVEKFVLAVASETGVGTTVYLTDDLIVDVAESVNTIYKRIEKLNNKVETHTL